MSDHPAPHGDVPNSDSATAPVTASDLAGSASVEDIRKQVETEQALSDSLKRVQQLEAQIKQVSEEKAALATEKDGSSG